MTPNHLFFASKKNPSTNEQEFSNEVEYLTLKAGNKIFTKHLEFSSEVDHLILLDKLPTLHEAELVLTFIESLKAVDLGNNPANPRHVHISTTLSTDEKIEMIDLLQEYKDVFA
ncbi:hypothetical protein SLE2022_323600 [Rubroshorea leprosula]